MSHIPSPFFLIYHPLSPSVTVKAADDFQSDFKSASPVSVQGIPFLMICSSVGQLSRAQGRIFSRSYHWNLLQVAVPVDDVQLVGSQAEEGAA